MTNAHMIGWAVAAALLWLLGYGVACWVWPFTACRRCKGSGIKRSPSGKNWRRCRKCKGNSERLRLGRRIWNWMAGTAHKAVG